VAEKQETKEAPAKDELQVAVSPDTSLRKVELDLDDAPFLQEQESPPPAKTGSAPLQVPAEAPAPNKKKNCCSLRARLPCLCCWWRPWPYGGLSCARRRPRRRKPVKPEVIVVPSAKSPTAKPDSVKELAPFVIPRQTAKGARFLICKFSTVSQSPRVGMEIDQKLIPLRDALYYYLSSKSDAFLLDPASVPTIKKDLGGVLNDYLTQGRIDDILFESYLNE